jgi:prepilin-type N-terminal cleavage/methylation domain-containing protein
LNGFTVPFGPAYADSSVAQTGEGGLHLQRGFSLAELMVVVGIVAVLAAIGLPTLLSYYRASTLTAGAQELQTILNAGRQLAINRNAWVCVEQAGTRVRFRPATAANNCTGPPWTGPGTDSGGWMTLTNGVRITAATANVIFNYLGAAAQTGTYTVQNPTNNGTTTVTVVASGRITIP